MLFMKYISMLQLDNTYNNELIELLSQISQ